MINTASGVISALVVLIFAVVKFNEGAWLVVILFPVLWLILMRLNKRYRDEAQVARPRHGDPRRTRPRRRTTPRHTVLVLIDRLDLAVLRALRYAGSIRPTDIRVVHIMLDSEVAKQLERDWVERDLGDRFPLTVVECR